MELFVYLVNLFPVIYLMPLVYSCILHSLADLCHKVENNVKLVHLGNKG